MPEFVAFYFRVLVALIAICDPLGNMPIFVSLTSGADRPDPARTARVAAVTVFVVFTVFAVTGEGILKFFGIHMASFRVAGGILLLLMGVNMLQATVGPMRRKPDEITEAAERDTVGVVPIAIPLLSGPGAMTTVIVYANQAVLPAEYLAQHAAQLTATLVLYVAMRSAAPVMRRMGRTGINIVTRVMGLIVVAIGVEFIAGGARELFPVLAG